MYELLNIAMSLIAGFLLYLTAIRKIKTTLKEETLVKYSQIMKIIAIFLIFFAILNFIITFLNLI